MFKPAFTAAVCLLVFFLELAGAQPQSEDLIAIVGATVVDGAGAEPVEAAVLLQGERIAAVGPDLAIPAGARRIDGKGKTLIPGLFDLHTHLPYSAARGFHGDWGKHLKAYLYCGVTSVVDFGVYPEMFEPMRRLQEASLVVGPRLSLAARITTPGGHGAEGGRGDFFSLQVRTPHEARVAVRRLLPYRPDVIKAFTDGWRYGLEPEMTSMNEETLAALVEEAHKHGLEVLTHTVTLERAKTAARAGVDVIAHGIGDAFVDDELVRLMTRQGTVYAPTLAVYHPRGRDILTPLLAALLEPAVRNAIHPPLTPPKTPGLQLPLLSEPGQNGSLDKETPRQRRWRHLVRNNAKLRAAGIAFGVGTDAGVPNAFHGWATLRELQLLVHGGLTPLEAITAATRNSARALGVEDQRGTIEAGKLADLVLIGGSPHRRIADIEKVERVFLGGREIDRARLKQAIASPALTPIPARGIEPRIDDLESGDGRSRLGTLWVNSTDSGNDPSQMMMVRASRAPGNRALTVLAHMSHKKGAFASADLPLSRGGVEPVDVSGYRGIRFEARGEGEYGFIVTSRGVRDFDYHQALFSAGPQWGVVTIEFSSLQQKRGAAAVPWTGKDAQMLMFRIERPAGESAWLELDNIELYQ